MRLKKEKKQSILYSIFSLLVINCMIGQLFFVTVSNQLNVDEYFPLNVVILLLDVILFKAEILEKTKSIEFIFLPVSFNETNSCPARP